jgi:hypothetical protein
MNNGQIFISYRRDDSAGYARALYDRLVQQFSKERVFMDVDAIEPGLPFDEAIKRALDQCKVLLVVIGKHWMDKQAGIGPRINDPKDFVRLEIAVALSRNIRVVPVLLDGASMPSEKELPEPLRALTRRNALEISNSRFGSDSETLIMVVRKALGETGGRAVLRNLRGSKPLLYWLAGGLALAVLSAIVYLYWPPKDQKTPVQPALSEITGAAKNTSGLLIQEIRSDINGKWEADVAYDWPNARYVEKFDFHGEGNEVHGTASFLGRKKGILEGSIRKNGLRFIIRTQESLDGDSKNSRDVVHRYRGELLGNGIKFIMQTEGGYSEHIPIEFIAKKVQNNANEADVKKPDGLP